MNPILHIVPATPPAFNGLGDYARMLHRHWPDPDQEWHVASLNVAEGAEAAWPNVTFHSFGQDAQSLTQALLASECKSVCLHYVPHGYHPKGIPAWLPRGLEDWKAVSKGRLTTFFHEVFAKGPPWKTSFWLFPRAVRVLRDIYALSDSSIASNMPYVDLIEKYCGREKAVSILPIGSNVKTITRASGPGLAPWRIAVFGGAGTRSAATKVHEPLLRFLAEREKIDKIVLIGADGGPQEASSASVFGAVETYFNASEEAVSHAIASCHFGITASEPSILTKSTVFAAYSAHGLPTLVPGPPHSETCFIPTHSRSADAILQEMEDGSQLDQLRSKVGEYARRVDWPVIAQGWRVRI